MSKENAAEAGRIPALNVAHYERKYGTLQFENLADLLRAQTIDPETAKFLSVGMQNLVGVLAQVTGLADDGSGDEVH